MFNLLVTLIVLMLSFSDAFNHPNYFKRDDHSSQNCPSVLLAATFDQKVHKAVGQLTLHQSNDGSIWTQGAFQSGFWKDSWTYEWTIQNGCGHTITTLSEQISFDVTDTNSCGDTISYTRKSNGFRRNDKSDEHSCSSVVGPSGISPIVVNVNEWTWHCGGNGIKFQTCEGEDIYKKYIPPYLLHGHDKDDHENRTDDDTFSAPKKRVKDLAKGSLTGLYVVINGCETSKGRRGSSSMRAAAPVVNINGDGNVITPPNPPANDPANPPANNPANPPANNPANPPANNPANPPDATAPVATDATAPTVTDATAATDATTAPTATDSIASALTTDTATSTVTVTNTSIVPPAATAT
ncbi:6965_t:CDS:1 [Cetraspora pellucida]|uniref:6965_t:CDS:1 n=1 Tax=Cetraspora pellucida TaxID=1433469 RepID=A0A9N8ZBI6_9GLOM|nr:6965_t:CDS:1 [Cetraspora pellucida]